MASLADMAAAKGRQIEHNTLSSVKVQQIHYTKLKPSESNFYGQREIEEIADSIAMAGILQPLVVRKTDLGEYEVIVGHRRRLGSIMNVERGIKECEFLPCIEIKASDKIVQEIKKLANMTDKEAEDMFVRYVLIATNSTQRELTDYERMLQVMEYKEIIPYMRGDMDLKGRALRTEIAKEMKSSTGTVGTYEAIYHNLIQEGMERFRKEEIGVSIAAGLSQLPEDIQKCLVNKQDLKLSDVKTAKEILAGTYEEEKEPQTVMNTRSETDFEENEEYEEENTIQKEPQILVNTKYEADFDEVSEFDTQKESQSMINTRSEADFEEDEFEDEEDEDFEELEEYEAIDNVLPDAYAPVAAEPVQSLYSQYAIRVYKTTGMEWKETDNVEEMLEYLQMKVKELDNIGQISITPRKIKR